MKFSTIEIKLCQDIAKKYWKEIKKGGWFVCGELDSQILLFDDLDFQVTVEGKISTNIGFYKEWFPLWTLEDCLGFLRKHSEKLSRDMRLLLVNALLDELMGETAGKKGRFRERCLKAVLAVLGEEGK